MKIEQPELNFDGPKRVPYSETFPKPGESDEEYMTRTISLLRDNNSGKIILDNPTEQDLARQEEERNKELNELRDKPLPQQNTDVSQLDNLHPSDRAKFEQMKKRKDLDY